MPGSHDNFAHLQDPGMSETIGTAFGGVNFALCGCCTDHEQDEPLEFPIVKCRECGSQCSCIGCVAEESP